MSMKKYSGIYRSIFALIIVMIMIIGLSACPDDTTNPPMMPATYSFDLEVFRGAPELYVDSTIYFKGTLYNQDGAKLSNEKIVFSSEPSDIGYVSPNAGGSMTTLLEDDGFEGEVKFTGRAPGSAVVWARYWQEDILKASDSLHVLVREWGNE